jgi:hypothetical protein
MLPLAALGLLVGPVGTALGEAVDRRQMDVGIFAILLIPVGFLLRPVASQAQVAALGVKQRPWLNGRLRGWQRLILPFHTGAVLSTGLSCVMAGGGYLLGAEPGWSAPNSIAFATVMLGALLLGFGLARLLAGVLIVQFSGLWAAPKWAWRMGGLIVVLGSLAQAVYSAQNISQLVSWM